MISKNNSSLLMRVGFGVDEPRDEKKSGNGGVRRNKPAPIATRKRMPDVRDVPSFKLTPGKKLFLERMLPTIEQEKEGHSTLAITNQVDTWYIPVDETMTDANERHFDPLRFKRTWKLEPERALPRDPEAMEVDVPEEPVVDRMEVDEEIESGPATLLKEKEDDDDEDDDDELLHERKERLPLYKCPFRIPGAVFDEMRELGKFVPGYYSYTGAR